MTDYSELKRLAEQVGTSRLSSPDFGRLLVKWTKYVTPNVILALIAENERLESEALYSAAGFDAAREEVERIKADNEALRKGSGKAADALAAARKALMVARPRTATHMELMTAALYAIDAAISQGEQA